VAILRLHHDLRAEMIVYARESLPEEACGFLLGTQDLVATALRNARNLNPRRNDRFTIAPEDYAKAERHCARHPGTRVLGFWHSHPQSPARPSAVDLEEARGLFVSFPERYLYIIVSMAQDEPEITCWRLDESGQRFEQISIE
jgi:proteasome lid subunit RPN8/RPN11